MSKYAIVETGSKQYWVEADSVLEVEKLQIPEGQNEVALERVLFAKDSDHVQIGQPVVKNAKVVCEFLGNVRGPKVIHFKFKRRKASRRIKGHRQDLTKLRVKEIQL